MKVAYRERLSDETVDVSLPETRRQAFELMRDIQSLAAVDAVKWKAAVRMYTASDLYMLALHLSCSRRRSAWTGHYEIDSDFQFQHARAIQEQSHGIVDVSARAHWKSTWKTHVLLIREVLVNPDVTIGIFSFEKDAAKRHLKRILDELDGNDLMKMAWDDVLWSNPKMEAPAWSVESGAVVKRNVVTLSPTFAAYTFMSGIPTGSRLSLMAFDDIENEKSTANADLIDKGRKRFASAMNLAGEGGRVLISGTYHVANGILGDLVDKGWPERCMPAEDTSKPSPNIAEEFDKADGMLADSGERMPPAIRNVKLEGAPTFLHPLELAVRRFGQPLDDYRMQNLGQRKGKRTYEFKEEWIKWYDEAPEQVAAGWNVYMVVDPSAGLKDPYVCLAFAIMPDGRALLVDGERKLVPPGQMCQEIANMALRWNNLGTIMQVRVEEYGQATFSFQIDEAFKRVGLYLPIVRCRDNQTSIGMVSASGRSAAGSNRPWVRLQAPFAQGRILFPRALHKYDAEGKGYDLIHYFLEHEYGPFPSNKRDDMWSALCLLHDPSKEAGPLLSTPPDRDAWDDEEETSHDSAGRTWMSNC